MTAVIQFTSYLDQLHHAAAALDVDLKHAVISAGLGDCTYYRWKNNSTTPNETKARLVFDTIMEIGGERVISCARQNR